MKFRSRKAILILVCCLVVLLIFSYSFFSFYKEKHTLYSYAWLRQAMLIVKDKKPSPPASARFYAYVSTVYYEVLAKTDSQYQASLATEMIINYMYPDFSTSTHSVLEGFKFRDRGSIDEQSMTVVEAYRKRLEQDEVQKVSPKRPYGEPYWTGDNPLEVTAASWQRWLIPEENFPVPEPPVYGSAEYRDALVVVKNAMSITNEQAKKIEFWGGAPGTEAPAGIWQNRLHSVVEGSGITDKRYAYIQMVLAQSLADSFMECWRVKYTFWTKRPSMGDKSIDLIYMANPSFPSYVSGHSTISFTAATVLSALLPQYKDIWTNDAEEAKSTRLWAGIHFSHDNEVGKMLGIKVGEAVLRNLGF